MKYKLFKSKIDILRNSGSASWNKRLLATLIDFLIMVLVTLSLFNLTYLIIDKNNNYNAYKNTVTNEITYYNKLINETHLVEFTDDSLTNRKDTDTMALETISKQINFAYKLDLNSGGKNFSSEPISTLKFGESSLTNDNLTYFYGTYLIKHNENNDLLNLDNMNPYIYLNNLIKKNSNTNYDRYFAFIDDPNDANYGLTYIKPYVANEIYKYLFSDYENGKSYFNDINNIYCYLFEISEKLVLDSASYKVHYANYNKALISQGDIINLGMISTILVSYLLVIVTPKLLFKDDATIGRKVLGLGLIDSKNLDNVKWYILLTRSVFGFLAYLVTAFAIPILPMFNFSYTTFSFPFIYNGPTYFNLGVILLVIIVINLISSVFSLFTKKKVTLLDIITRTKLVDEQEEFDENND